MSIKLLPRDLRPEVGTALRLKKRRLSPPITTSRLQTTTQIHLERPLSKAVHFDSTLSGALKFDR